MQQTLLLLLLLAVPLLQQAASAQAPAAEQGADEPADTSDLPSASDGSADFTAAQLASARTRLSELFDASMDRDADGKLTRRELMAWLAAVARQQADSDLDEAWGMYTANSSSDSLLHWDTYASARATTAAAAGSNDKDDQAAANMAGLQAEVRRAIDEASKETGLDKAGIKVSVPTLPPSPSPPTSSSKSEQQQLHQEQLAMELAKDRRRWEAADADGDGRLSRVEFRDFAFADSKAARMRPVLALEALERMDANGDGRVSLVEFLAEGAAAHGETAKATTTAKADDAKNFRQVWDANKDGYMDAEEMGKMLDYLDSTAAAKTATATPGKGEGESENATMDEEEMEEHAEEADRLMASADADRDGSLSKAEVVAKLVEFAGSAATNYGDSVGVHDEL